MNNVLATICMNICTNIAGTYNSPSMHDDMVQEGMLACLEKSTKYNEEMYQQPEAYFYFVAKGAISRYYTHGSKVITPAKTRSRTEDLNQAFSSTEGDDIIDLLADPKNHAQEYADADERSKLMGYISDRLSPSQLDVIYMRYYSKAGEVRTCEEVGGILGVSASSVSRIETAAVKELQGFRK
tara:strand:- start:147 stop:695 length:549 start_codon:yes stop_codon:yes gene_type:complete